GRVDRDRAGAPPRGTRLFGGTAYLCAADADGTVVSLIQTNFNEFGSGLTVPGWGINLQNRGCSFSLDPVDVNVVAPGKWTVHTLIPALGLREGEPWLVFGTQGGDAQAQIHLQVLARVVDDASDLQAALDAPRWRIRPGAWTLEIEPRFGQDVLDGLAARGHEVSPVGEFDDFMGYVEAIRVEADGYAGAGDPRAESAVLGF
ncbi:MAG TPA: gamma-glutamyltransferase, partial [Acidimicrobiia bacterium]|nr:gamma-glutamyltransferase [Acidimicrobiia bacterium]